MVFGWNAGQVNDSLTPFRKDKLGVNHCDISPVTNLKDLKISRPCDPTIPPGIYPKMKAEYQEICAFSCYYSIIYNSNEMIDNLGVHQQTNG